MNTTNRVAFLVDGFNLYHSLLEAAKDTSTTTKWLDLKRFCSSYLYLLGSSARLETIIYFSALATHRDAHRPETTTRHKNYADCLRATGVVVELGRFKPKDVRCRKCGFTTIRYEEKETDVAVSVRLLELLSTDRADTVFLVTGDTDLAPAVRTAQSLFPTKEIGFVFPYKRQNAELAKLVNLRIKVKAARYSASQLPDPFVLPSGRKVSKPSAW